MIYKSTVPDYDPDYNICKVFSRIVVDMALMALVHLLFTRMAAAVLPDRMPVPSGHIPGMVIALLLIMAYTELIRGERTLAWIGGTLIQLGMALQVCLAPAYSAASASDTVRLSWVLVFSTAAALAVVPVLYVGAEYLCGRYRLYWFTAGLSALYTICLMLSVSISDSSIWYFFGPMTWPLLLTLLALVMEGAVFADPFRMPWRKITDALLLLLVNSVFLLAVGKPSLVLFLAVVTLLTGNIYLPAKKARSALIIGSAPIVCGLCALWYGNMSSVPGSTLFEKLKLQLAPLDSSQHTALAKKSS